MDLVKVRQQSTAGAISNSSAGNNNSRRAVASTLLRNPSSLSTTGMLRTIVVQEGVHGLYRGVSSPLLAVTPAFAVSFWSCDLAKNVLVEYEHERGNTHATKDNLSIAQVGLAGAFSGLPLACIFGPSERIKCLLQVDKSRYSGFADCAKQLYLEGGMASIFRGTFSCLLRDVPGNMAYFGTYEAMKRQLCYIEQRETPSTISILFSGGMAGVANWIVAIPFDVVKSRWQTAPTGKYRNLADVLLQTVRQEGPSALFRGLSAALLRAFPANAACLWGVETARYFFFDGARGR